MADIDDNIVKSIIYGNQVSNRYGKFRAFCSPLSQEDVENVLIAVGIEQYDPLARFDQTNFRIIVERSKDLLNNLYTRVVQTELEQNKIQQIQSNSKGNRFIQQGKGQNIKRQQLPIKKQNIEIPFIDNTRKFNDPVKKEYNRPNHIFAEGKPQFLNQKVLEPEKQKENQRKKQMMQLVEKVKEQGYQLEKITANMDARFFLQMKQAIQYDHNKLTEKILKMLMIIVELDTREQLLYEYNLQEGLQNMSVNELDDQKVKFINDMLRVDKYLTKDSLEQSGSVLKPLFEMLCILVKSYENNKKLAQLEEEHYQFHNEMEEQEENDKFYSSGQKDINLNSIQKQQLLIQNQSQNQFGNNNNQLDEEFIMQILQEQNLKSMNEQQKQETLQVLNHFYISKANQLEFHKNYWQNIGYKENGKQGEAFQARYYENGFLESTFGDDKEFFALEIQQGYHCFENDEENYKPCYECPKILREYLEARKLIKLKDDDF
ncbi:hypothetical protein PPERSA_02967 [Pseudocohnilembus persalinus]|uniref:Uncharacterized protein n=1 Tax=Pseudocohnilembus persalinus TaxID=266149 RepID=A0A0V0QAG4_PSEPJ|nr:hypothetical protein PPERSA_02967 [Pseudocohnilembus persalinus]|eukprot:KRW99135.1 hypothetical protein PPERSA_02967 [Pseudocohnilembus persalinus]